MGFSICKYPKWVYVLFAYSRLFFKENLDFPLKTKSDTFRIFKQRKSMIDNQTNKKIKASRTDKGIEFCNFEFNSFCTESGILRHIIVTYTPHQNDVAERINGPYWKR